MKIYNNRVPKSHLFCCLIIFQFYCTDYRKQTVSVFLPVLRNVLFPSALIKPIFKKSWKSLKNKTCFRNHVTRQQGFLVNTTRFALTRLKGYELGLPLTRAQTIQACSSSQSDALILYILAQFSLKQVQHGVSLRLSDFKPK